MTNLLAPLSEGVVVPLVDPVEVREPPWSLVWVAAAVATEGGGGGPSVC